MEPPSTQEMGSRNNFSAGEDEQDKIVNECCSCFYDCLESLFDFLCCSYLC
uniref:Uncharacterized protein n=1 Tax=Nelumbo nucifera TaxID=4432 RepID=A0A822ZU53_NELNU|nr:TPA_asm: hypothetical protein HUJ06_016988 [Nelumbo nucifera]